MYDECIGIVCKPTDRVFSGITIEQYEIDNPYTNIRVWAFWGINLDATYINEDRVKLIKAQRNLPDWF